MIEKLKYLLAGSLLLAAAGGFVACDDDETTVDEWEATYVYMKGSTIGNEKTKAYKVIETAGLQDNTPLAYSFRVCLNKPAAEAVSVALELNKSGNVGDTTDETVSFDAFQVTIPAGQTDSDPIEVSIDPSFLGLKDAQGTYENAVFVFSLKNLVAAPKDVRLSTKTNKVTLTLAKTVVPYLNMATGIAGTLIADRSGWGGTLGSGVEGAIGKLFDGSTGTDVAANSAPWDFTIDLGEVVKIAGANTRHWSSSYAPSQIEVLTSVDNSTWKSQGVLNVSASYSESWHFIDPVEFRYMKYVVLAPNRRVDVTEFYLYAAE